MPRPLRTALLRVASALVAVACLPGCANGPPGGEARLALVIGNAAYVNAPALNNPANDAADMCAALKRLHFQALCYTNLRDRAETDAAVRAYVDQLTPTTVGVVFYSGHGVEVNGANFLIPTEVQPRAVSENPLRVLYGLDDLFDRMRQRPASYQLVILDACRTELFVQTPSQAGMPAPKPGAKSMLVRSLETLPKVGNGLAPITDAPPHTSVLYATASREAAYDGRGRNGPLTKQVLENIETRDQPLSTFLQRVTEGVESETRAVYKRPMTPFVYGSLTDKFCFAGCFRIMRKDVAPSQ